MGSPHVSDSRWLFFLSDDVDDHPTHSAAKSYIFIGILTFLHSLLELGLAIWLK